MTTKVIAYYLPAFHEVKENNIWYGKGFTEWDNCKKGKKMYKGHYQPRLPLNDNYYDLSDIKAMKTQAELANEYGVYGFCFYHYWFEGRQILEKPSENLLNNKDININFCFAWANESWQRTWHDEKGDSELLIEQTYNGKKDWMEHYIYLRNFFLDQRYIKVDNKPMILFYRIERIPDLDKMLDLWTREAIKDGFDGIHSVQMITNTKEENANYHVDAKVDFEPCRTVYSNDKNVNYTWWRNKRRIVCRLLNYEFTSKYFRDVINYNAFYRSVLRKKKNYENFYYGSFCDWDNTPRKGKRGWSFKKSSPKRFGYYFDKIITLSEEEQKEFVFIFAWNEWGEGGYLEPDKIYQYSYLNQIKKIINR